MEPGRRRRAPRRRRRRRRSRRRATTQVGMILGTAAYMAPEQARGQAGRQARRHLGVRRRALRDADGHARCSRATTISRHARRRADAGHRLDGAAGRHTRRGCGGCSSAVSSAIRRSACATSAKRAWRSRRSKPARRSRGSAAPQPPRRRPWRRGGSRRSSSRRRSSRSPPRSVSRDGSRLPPPAASGAVAHVSVALPDGDELGSTNLCAGRAVR